MANIKNFGIVGLGSNVQFGKGGAKLVQTEGTFAAKSADNTAFVRFAIANAVQNDDAVTLQQLNAAVAAVSGDFDALQLELDATQAGAGLAADGSYVASVEGVLAGATSLKDADDKLAAALAVEAADRVAADQDLNNAVAAVDGRVDSLQSELDASQASVGLTAEGALVLADGNYLANATTLVQAVEALDAAAKAAADAAVQAQSEVDAVEARADALEGNAVAQQAAIDAANAKNDAQDGRLDALESAVADNSRVEALEANAIAQQAEIDAVEARVTTNEGAIAALEGNAVAQQAAIDAAAGRLTTAEADILALEGDMVAAEAAHAALLANAIVKDGSVAMIGDLDLGNNAIKNVATPVELTDAANKGYVDAVVSNLGNAFNYVGTLSGGADEENAFDLATLEEGGKDVGDYYKVIANGYFKLDGVVRYFNTNDGLVFNEAGSFDKIDNTDSVVTGTAGQVVVDGNVDTGFIVSIDGAYTAARQAEVSNEANARAAADALLAADILDLENGLADEVAARIAGDAAAANAVAAVAADLAQEIIDRTDAVSAVQVEVDALEGVVAALEASTTANAVAQQAAIDALEAKTADDSRIIALEANAVAQQAEIDALEATDVLHAGRMTAIEGDLAALEAATTANAVAQQSAIDALEATDVVHAGRLDAAEAGIAALEGNAVAQQAEIDALEMALENLSQDTITSINEKYSVHAADTAVEVTNVDAAAKLEVTLDNAEARLSVVSSEADADLRLVAQGAGQVIIGEEGVGIIQADDGYDMTVAGGAGGGNLKLKGAEVTIQDENGTDVATFVSGGSAHVALGTTNSAVTFAAEGAEADVDLVFDPKGSGRVDVSGARVVNVAKGVEATDAVNKGQLEAAVAAAEVGHIVSLSASVAAANGQVSLGAVTGVVTRVRVVVLGAYNAGASLTVGTQALASDLVAAADLDESAAGVYLIETAREYAGEELVVEIAGATAGAAKVYVEYIKG